MPAAQRRCSAVWLRIARMAANRLRRQDGPMDYAEAQAPSSPCGRRPIQPLDRTPGTLPAGRLRDAIERIALVDLWSKQGSDAMAEIGLDFLAGQAWGRGSALGSAPNRRPFVRVAGTAERLLNAAADPIPLLQRTPTHTVRTSRATAIWCPGTSSGSPAGWPGWRWSRRP